MYQIALCDDEEKELDRIETYLAGYQDKRQTQKYRVRRFTSGEAMVDLIREELYMPDLILLDIFMSGITGMDAAKEMRGMGCGVPIIFLTTSRDHALCAYEVDAVQYLVKPLDQDRFYHAMDSDAKGTGEPDRHKGGRGSASAEPKRYPVLRVPEKLSDPVSGRGGVQSSYDHGKPLEASGGFSSVWQMRPFLYTEHGPHYFCGPGGDPYGQRQGHLHPQKQGDGI